MDAITAKVRLGRLRKLHISILLPSCLLVLIAGLGSLRVPAPAQTAAKAATFSFTLKYLETSGLITKIDPGQQEVKFRKEPNFGTDDKIVRRALKVGPNPGDFVGFAVNLTSHTLYLDLNQNLDLTDDPRGVYRSENMRSSILLSFFKGVRLSFSSGGVNRSYLLEPFYFLGENSSYIGIRSSYAGEVELQGQKWQFQVQDNLDGQLDAQDKFLFTPVAREGEPKGIPYSPMPVPKNLFLEGHEYQLGFAFKAASGDSPLTVTFAQITSPMAELTLDGQFVRRLLLQGDRRLVILDSPSHTIPLPADNYRIRGLYLQPAPDKPALASSSETSPFVVTTGAPYRLRVGAPFVSYVTADRNGNMLRLRYILTGAAGEQYAVINPDRGNPPKFVIYKGDQVVATGSFQYG
ncbi:MAG: hypothetical protein LAP85_28225 [Acidobacteriia bacterium]|nr:hypothetical protein [Terriglobia bacterium]